MKIEKTMKLRASSVPSLLAGNMSLIMCLVVTVVLSLTSCQSGYYSNGYNNGYLYPQQYQHQYQRYTARPVYEVPRVATTSSQLQRVNLSKAPPKKVSGQNSKAKNHTAKKRMPEPQSSHVTPPPTRHGYHARLDKTLYPSMHYQPFYRVLGSDGVLTYLSESVFWQWYSRSRDHVFIRIFDPYDPKAPPARQ